MHCEYFDIIFYKPIKNGQNFEYKCHLRLFLVPHSKKSVMLHRKVFEILNIKLKKMQYFSI
jgi:hypothetical protein